MSDQIDEVNEALNQESRTLCEPLWYAVGAIFTTPATAVLLLFASIGTLLIWPFIPFYCYLSRKKLLRQIAEGKVLAPFDKPWP